MRTIMELITEYIENAKIGYPIFTSDIHDYVLNEIEDAKPLVINEYINRYEKNNNDFIRYKKGIYYKCVDTVFGKTKIKQGELIRRLSIYSVIKSIIVFIISFSLSYNNVNLYILFSTWL